MHLWVWTLLETLGIISYIPQQKHNKCLAIKCRNVLYYIFNYFVEKYAHHKFQGAKVMSSNYGLVQHEKKTPPKTFSLEDCLEEMSLLSHFKSLWRGKTCWLTEAKMLVQIFLIKKLIKNTGNCCLQKTIKCNMIYYNHNTEHVQNVFYIAKWQTGWTSLLSKCV